MIFRSHTRKRVVADNGYERYLKAGKGAFVVDHDKARDEERFDGMWFLRTNTELSTVEVALRYKQLWMVEQVLRTPESLLDTRPIFHKTDATICGHVFCSFLALVLRDELFRRMDSAGASVEWNDIVRDLNALTDTAITYNGKTLARVEFWNVPREGVGDGRTFEHIVSVFRDGVVAGEGRGIPGTAHDCASVCTAVTSAATRPDDSWAKRSTTASSGVTQASGPPSLAIATLLRSNFLTPSPA